MRKLTPRARHEHPNHHDAAYGHDAFQHEELLCALNAAESRFNRAVRDNEIAPLGTIGRVTLFVVTPDELERLRKATGR